MTKRNVSFPFSCANIAVLILLYATVAEADWSVSIGTVSGQSFAYSTGSESGSEMKVEVYDFCRRDSATRNYMGEFYPSSTVTGIAASGSSTSVSFSFTEGINGNTNIYTDNGGNTATVEFCSQVGLYYSSTLINFAEVKLTYTVDLVTNFASLTGYMVTAAEAYTDAADTAYSFDGTLFAYFCNPSTYAELSNDGSVTHQGSTLSLCFKVPDGNFEIADVKDLTVKNAIAAEPSQTIIVNTVVATATYAEKTCYDASNADTNICVVSFLLKADFYDFNQLTLTGSGNILLEFGGASGATRRLVRHRLLTSDERVGHVTVKAMEMRMEPPIQPEATNEGGDESNTSFPAAAAALVAMAALCLLALMMVFARCKRRATKKEQIYQKLRIQKKEQMDYSESYLTSETIDLTMSFSTIPSSQNEITSNGSRPPRIERGTTNTKKLLPRADMIEDEEDNALAECVAGDNLSSNSPKMSSKPQRPNGEDEEQQPKTEGVSYASLKAHLKSVLDKQNTTTNATMSSNKEEQPTAEEKPRSSKAKYAALVGDSDTDHSQLLNYASRLVESGKAANT